MNYIPEREFEIAEERRYYVVQRNDLVRRARFELKGREKGTKKNVAPLTITEHKLFLYLISKIKPGAVSFDEVELDAKKFYEVIGGEVSKTSAYTRLRQAVENLFYTNIVIDRPECDRDDRMWILSTSGEYKTGGKIIVKLNSDLLPYLTKLYSNYTQYTFHNILKFKSQAGISLYQLLKSYEYDREYIRISIVDLKELLGLNYKCYENFVNFKRKVIEPAINDINEYTDLKVSVQYEKTGRNTTHIIFKFKEAKGYESQERYDNVEMKLLTQPRKGKTKKC